MTIEKVDTYDADSIQMPTDLEHIRLRPGMYVGETSDPRQLFSEALDNALDEAQSGYADKPIVVSVDTEKNLYRVRDYGRGIPHGTKIDPSGKEKEVLEILCTKANSGAKFSNKSYPTPGGLHGIGMSCISALSDVIDIKTHREGRTVKFVGYKGVDHEVTIIDKSGKSTGVDISFIPDPKVFDSVVIPMDFIIARCTIAKAFKLDIRLFVDDEEVEIPVKSLSDLVTLEKGTSEYSNDYFEYESDEQESIRIVMKYSSGISNKTQGFTNLINNKYGGTHVRLFERAVCDVWEEFTQDTSVPLKRDDCLLGLNSLVAIFIRNIEFTSQVKDKLSIPNREVRPLIDGFKEQFRQHLKDNPKMRTALLKRFEEYRAAQNKILSQKEIMNLIKINDSKEKTVRRRSVVKKLIECTSNKAEGTELWIVEGDSAAGPIARTRDNKTQAVLPLRGKIKNITYSSIKDALKSEEVLNIVNSIGIGVGDDSDPDKCRYEKVIIMTDSDPDGAHIVALVLSVLVNIVPNLVKAGKAYVCEAPLYGWETKESKYNFTNDFDDVPKEIKESGNFTRYKGLGQMDDDEFRESCLIPGNRLLYRVQYPSDIEKFNHILGTSSGKAQLMRDLDIIREI